MTGMPQMTQTTGGSSSGSLYKVVELILDRGLVIDVFVRVSLVGLEVLTIDARVVVAGVDAYLRFAETCGRIDLTGSSSRIGSSRIGGSLAGSAPPLGLPGLAGQMAAGPARTEIGVAKRKDD